ncbi:FAD-dependent tricarballylate dehydrogenase TcuA [Bacillus safensis]|uniref:FAD-dependent tricarballylate dehydrogenase TcuA n=1 Tax=Bacillus safensis TaxID=561879 RepID=UPI00192C1E27|nr:FAD-dependent tricarballylate dehydrogenase TcuA [Bacillus safensis]
MNNSYDVIVVGGGNAALCAAISAHEGGANVLVLERAPIEKRGGNSYFTDGAIRVAYNRLDMLREVLPDLTDYDSDHIVMPTYTEDDFMNDLMRVTSGKSDNKLAHHLISKSFETIKWMYKNGVKFELNYDNQSYEKEGKRHFWGGLPLKTSGKGVGLIKQLYQRVDQLGIKVEYDARTVDLISVDDGVTGVVVEKNGELVQIYSKTVILACGSFEANKKMRIEFLGKEWEGAIVRGTKYNTGDGLDMAVKAGASKYGDWSSCHSIGTDYNAPAVGDFNKPGDIYKKSSFPLGLMFNLEGKRFVDEGADFRNYTYAKYGREILKQPGHKAFQVFDAKVHPLLRDEYTLDEATCYQADSLEELADLMKISKEVFKDTIQEYNLSVQEGDYNPSIKDGKGTVGITPPKTNWALTIDQAPYYAYPVTCGVTFAFGGLRVNTNAEVLNSINKPIKGLYAAGEMVGGIFYENYPGGSGLMSGSVLGKTAGFNAASFLKQHA